jgi:uncharacterized protein (DUF1778 family)
LIKRTAALRGTSVGKLMVDAAREKAHASRKRVTSPARAAAEQARFVALVLAPPKPDAGAKRAAEAHSKLIRSSRDISDRISRPVADPLTVRALRLSEGNSTIAAI